MHSIYKRYLTVKTDHHIGQGTLIIFSWGEPERLKMQLSYIGNIGKKVIWVDPLKGPALPDALDGAGDIERIEAVLARTPGEVELSRYSLPDLYSLAPPAAALTALMPGLKLADMVPVPGITTEVLGKKLTKAEGPFQVVIDTPGDERAVLDFLDKAKVLDRVTTMVLRCGVEPFFKKSPRIKTLLKMLDTRGFTLAAVDESEDPDWPLYLLNLDPRARLIQLLEDAGAQARTDLATAREEAATLRAELETRTQEHDAAEGVAAQAVGAQTALKADLEARTKEHDAVKKLAAQREVALSTLSLEQKKATALKTEKVLRLEHYLGQMQIDLRRAAQAQERTQAEADALCARYTTVQEERQTLLCLLQQLTPKLREAAKRVREIPLAEQSDVDALLEGATSGRIKKDNRS